jgi:hypothetical protein
MGLKPSRAKVGRRALNSALSQMRRHHIQANRAARRPFFSTD